jgi:hypothetical protein
MNSQDALTRSLRCFKSPNASPKNLLSPTSMEQFTYMKKKAQGRQNKPSLPKTTIADELQDYVLYLKWSIQSIEYEAEEILERIPDKSRAVKHRIESHILSYMCSATLQDDYWQIHGQCIGIKECPLPCHIYTTEGVYIRIDFSFRTM